MNDKIKFLRVTNTGAGKISNITLICTTVNRFSVELAPWRAFNNSTEKFALKLDACMVYIVNITQLTANNKPNWSSVKRSDKLDFFPVIDSQMKDPPSNAARPIESANSSNGDPAVIKSPYQFQFNFGFEDITPASLKISEIIARVFCGPVASVPFDLAYGFQSR